MLGIFYTISASTTAGLQLTSLESLNGASHTILILLMFIGGCGFSTAGGIKIYRFFLLKNCKKMFKKETRDTLSPANKKEIIATLLIITLFPIIATFTAIHLTGITDASFENAFFEAAGLITTGGLSSNVVTIEALLS